MTNIGADLDVIQNPALEDLSFPNLTNIVKRLHINGNAELRKLSFPSLTNINSNLSVGANEKLEYLQLPALIKIADDLTIEGNPQLTGSNSGTEVPIDFTSLVSVDGNIKVEDNLDDESILGLIPTPTT